MVVLWGWGLRRCGLGGGSSPWGWARGLNATCQSQFAFPLPTIVPNVKFSAAMSYSHHVSILPPWAFIVEPSTQIHPSFYKFPGS